MNIPTISNTITMKRKKSSQGRKKIEIKKIEEINNRQVTFSKRRSGLFKKASELCILTGAQIAILVNSPGGRFFAFGHPTADVLIDRYLNNNNSNNNNNVAMSEGSIVVEFNHHYMEVSKELEAEKRRREVIQDSKVLKNGSGVLWYEEDVVGMEVEELQQYMASFVELKRKVLVREDELVMIKKTPIFLGPNMLDDVVGGGVGYANKVADTMIPGNVVPPGAGFGFDWM